MKTIELDVDESILDEVDRATLELRMTRDEFVRTALERALRQREIIALEQQHARGYEKHPVKSGEFDGWEEYQAWGEP